MNSVWNVAFRFNPFPITSCSREKRYQALLMYSCSGRAWEWRLSGLPNKYSYTMTYTNHRLTKAFCTGLSVREHQAVIITSTRQWRASWANIHGMLIRSTERQCSSLIAVWSCFLSFWWCLQPWIGVWCLDNTKTRYTHYKMNELCADNRENGRVPTYRNVDTQRGDASRKPAWIYCACECI